MGPARITPATSKCQRPSKETPVAITPQAKAHIGGNQVMGLSNSKIADGAGKRRTVSVFMIAFPTSKGAHLRRAPPSKYALRLLRTKSRQSMT